MSEFDKKFPDDDAGEVAVSTVSAGHEAGVTPEGMALANDPHRGLRMRHVQLIAISGSIGAALFVSIGNPLTSAGPLGLLIGVIFWAFVVFCASNCLIEMTCLIPVDGGFISFAERFVDKSFAMALGWNYVITQWALIAFELVALNVIVEYWASPHPAILISACLVAIGLLNLYSVRWFGEAEFWISITKVFLIVGLIFYTFVTMVGGNPLHDRYGFRFWRDPGVFAGTNFREVITGIFDSVCWATFAIVGPDYISLIGGEVRNPRRVLPRAFKSTIYRVFFFYVIGALCVGIVASSNDEALLGAIANGAPGAAKSPYVISMNRLQIPVLPSIVNAAVLVSLFSTTNSFVFAASRSLLGMAQRGQAPKILARTSKRGVPYVAILLTLSVACLAFLSVSEGSIKVLNWWINLVTAAQLVSWTCIAITYLRFRKGLNAQNLANGDFLPVKGWLQPFSGWWLLICSPIVLFFSGYYVFLPDAFTAADFIFAYGSVFLFLAILLVSKAYEVFVKHQSRVWYAPKELDFTSDLDKFEAMTVAAEYKRATKPRGTAKKVEDFFF